MTVDDILWLDFVLRIQEWQDSQITNFTPEDTESALRKLEEAAFRWDPGDQIESKYVKGFEAFLSPYEFKVQIDTSFGIKLTGAEVSGERGVFVKLQQYNVMCCLDWSTHSDVFDPRGSPPGGRTDVHQEVPRPPPEDQEGWRQSAEATEEATSEGAGYGAAGGLHASDAGKVIDYDDSGVILFCLALLCEYCIIVYNQSR